MLEQHLDLCVNSLKGFRTATDLLRTDFPQSRFTNSPVVNKKWTTGCQEIAYGALSSMLKCKIFTRLTAKHNFVAIFASVIGVAYLSSDAGARPSQNLLLPQLDRIIEEVDLKQLTAKQREANIFDIPPFYEIARDYEWHQCQILSQIVGYPELGDNFSIPFEDNYLRGGEDDVEWLTEQQTRDGSLQLLVDQHTHYSKYSYILALQRIAKLDPDAIRFKWNTECVVHPAFKLGREYSQELPNPYLKLQIISSEILLIQGQIENGFAAQLKLFLEENPNIRTIKLSLGGGVVGEAIEAGLEIRRRGIDTEVDGACLSACVYVLAGGASRGMPLPYGLVGFHAASSNAEARSATSEDYRVIANYLNHMGITADRILGVMTEIAPGTFEYPDQYFLCDTNLISWSEWSCYSPELAQTLAPDVAREDLLPTWISELDLYSHSVYPGRITNVISQFPRPQEGVTLDVSVPTFEDLLLASGVAFPGKIGSREPCSIKPEEVLIFERLLSRGFSRPDWDRPHPFLLYQILNGCVIDSAKECEILVQIGLECSSRKKLATELKKFSLPTGKVVNFTDNH